MRTLFLSVLFILLQFAAFCAEPDFHFDRTVHDFGDITVNDGPQSCTFTVTNRGSSPLLLLSVVSSCGCTDVSWTREEIPSGGKGEIRATYANEDGPYPFDKTLSVYLSGTRKPVILHIRGSVHSRKLPLSQTYPVHIGNIGLREGEFKVGNMVQGQTRSSEFLVANIGPAPVTLAWTDVSPQLSMPKEEVSVGAGETVRVVYSLRADRALWGKNYYYATPVLDGKVQGPRVAFWAITREDFSRMSEVQRENAPRAELEDGSVEYRLDFPAGEEYPTFLMKNSGKADLHIFRVQPDSERIKVLQAPESISPGSVSEFRFSADFSALGKDSETLYLVSIYTDSPFESVVHLYINAIIL